MAGSKLVSFFKSSSRSKDAGVTTLEKQSSAKDVDLTQDEWSNQSHSVEASAQEGYLCRIKLRTRLDFTPDQLFAIFSNPDNAQLFRDLGDTVRYEILSDDGNGVQEVEIEQQALFKFLAFPLKFSTRLYVHLDFNRNYLRFKLAKWGSMRKFEGEWNIQPVVENGKVVGTYATLDQNVLPLIVPPFMSGILQGVAVNAVRRMLEDLEKVAERVKNGENLAKILSPSVWTEKNAWMMKWRKEKEAEWGAIAKERKVEISDDSANLEGKDVRKGTYPDNSENLFSGDDVFKPGKLEHSDSGDPSLVTLTPV